MNALIHKLSIAAVVVGLSSVADAQSVSLKFGTTNAVLDEFDQLLPGTAMSPGAYVQILEARQGIFAPDTNGVHHANNPVIGVSQIGKGTDPTKGALGKVAGSLDSLADRGSPSNTNLIFARIFNKSTIADSSFYTDSQLFDVPVFGDQYGTFFIQASKTDTATSTGRSSFRRPRPTRRLTTATTIPTA